MQSNYLKVFPEFVNFPVYGKVRYLTEDVTLTTADSGINLIVLNPITVTLPNSEQGLVLKIIKDCVGTVTVAPPSNHTFWGSNISTSAGEKLLCLGVPGSYVKLRGAASNSYSVEMLGEWQSG